MSTLYEEGFLLVPKPGFWREKFENGFEPSLEELALLLYNGTVEANLPLLVREEEEINEAVSLAGNSFDPVTETWWGKWIKANRLARIAQELA